MKNFLVWLAMFLKLYSTKNTWKQPVHHLQAKACSTCSMRLGKHEYFQHNCNILIHKLSSDVGL